MRRGEILGLTWQDINWEKSELVILRHLHVSWLLAQGVGFKTIQESVVHASITTTLNTYTHLADENKAKAADIAA